MGPLKCRMHQMLERTLLVPGELADREGQFGVAFEMVSACKMLHPVHGQRTASLAG